MKIWVTVVSHRHGSTCFVGRTEQAVQVQLAEYCADNWPDDSPVPSVDLDAIEYYFNWHANYGGDLDCIEYSGCEELE